MVDKVGKENTIGFLEIDYEKLAQEIKEAKDARETRPAKPTRVVKPQTGNMYRRQSQSMIGFLEGDSVPAPERKAETPAPRQDENVASQKLSENPSMNSKQVFSARSGKISDNGGPNQPKTGNSIWEPDRIAKKIDDAELTNRERTKIAKDERAEAVRSESQQRLDAMVESIREAGIDQRKDATVKPIIQSGEPQAYASPNNAMSIFDKGDFERVPEKTEGEKLADSKAARRAEIDDSWRFGGKAVTSRDAVNRLFDGLMGDETEG
jgi:hypothetical protein